MNYVENDLLIQKREELKNDFKLFLKVCPFEMEGDYHRPILEHNRMDGNICIYYCPLNM